MSDKFIPASELYPLLFHPEYQARIWGGSLMTEVFHRELPSASEPIGEAWEISDRDDVQSVVANGALAGCTINELWRYYGRSIAGTKSRITDRFPLLIKLIDAGERLSLQVHPDDNACRMLGGGAEPKTEMWYVIAARPGAEILAGLTERATRLQLCEQLHSAEVEKLLQTYASRPGDSYYITSGTLHAIGAGNLILEIQQNSDTTYRISDWGRVDQSGKSRELHIEKGMRSINFFNRKSPRTPGVADRVNRNRKFDLVPHCPFFQVADLRLTSEIADDTRGQSFHLLSAVNHPVTVSGRGGEFHIESGCTALIPANYGVYKIIPECLQEETVVIKSTL